MKSCIFDIFIVLNQIKSNQSIIKLEKNDTQSSFLYFNSVSLVNGIWNLHSISIFNVIWFGFLIVLFFLSYSTIMMRHLLVLDVGALSIMKRNTIPPTMMVIKNEFNLNNFQFIRFNLYLINLVWCFWLCDIPKNKFNCFQHPKTIFHFKNFRTFIIRFQWSFHQPQPVINYMVRWMNNRNRTQNARFRIQHIKSVYSRMFSNFFEFCDRSWLWKWMTSRESSDAPFTLDLLGPAVQSSIFWWIR